MNSKYYENAAAIALVFDISNRETLLSCRKWYTILKNSINANNLFGVLIGNKSDYRNINNNDNDGESRAEILYEDGEKMAQELGLKYFETSAVNLYHYNLYYCINNNYYFK